MRNMGLGATTPNYLAQKVLRARAENEKRKFYRHSLFEAYRRYSPNIIEREEYSQWLLESRNGVLE